MATQTKHAQRSHYSYHRKAPFYRFHSNAFKREQDRAQRYSFIDKFNAFKNYIKKKKEEE